MMSSPFCSLLLPHSLPSLKGGKGLFEDLACPDQRGMGGQGIHHPSGQ